MPQGNTSLRAHTPKRKVRGKRLGVATASLALVVGGTVSSTFAGAQTNTPSNIAPYDANNFHNGEASASGETFRFNITQGNADIGLSYGSVMSGYRDITGRSNANALDLGVFPTLFGVEQCDGSPPILNPSTFPPKTVANSNEAGSEIAKPAEAFMPGYGQEPHGDRVGSQVATATKQPSSMASTASEDADMFFVGIIGGKSEATASLKDHVREARAVVTAKQLKILGGLITFENPKWEAVAKSGRVTDVSGSFTFSGATTFGIPRTAEEVLMDLNELKYNIEQILGPLGAKLELPTVIVTDNKVKVTPMSFKLKDPPFGAELIKPFLQNIQPLREQYVNDQLAADCKSETDLMMADIVLGILSGSGSAEIHTGGAEAWTDDTDFSVPPVAELPPLAAQTPTPAVESIPATPDSDYTYDLESTYIPGTDGTFGTTEFDTGDTAAPTNVAKKTVVNKKAKTQPAGPINGTQAAVAKTKAGTAAVAVGLAGLLGAIGLTFGEHLRERRTRRRIP